MTGFNVASREAMQGAQVIDFLGVTPIEQALNEVRSESTVCIVAAVTDLLLSSGDCGTIYASIDPVLDSFFTSLSRFCVSIQLSVLVAFQGLRSLVSSDSYFVVLDSKSWSNEQT